MKKQENPNSEKIVQVVSCALAVGVLILLLSGDIFMSKILRVNPNQDYPYEEKKPDNQENLENKKPSTPEDSSSVSSQPEVTPNPSNSDSSYDVSFMKETNLVELNSLIQSGETLFVFSGRSTCPPCREFVPILKKVATELRKENIYYLNQIDISTSTEGYQDFVAYSSVLQDRFGVTPYFMVFQNKQYMTERIGTMETKERLETYLQEVLTKY